MKTRFSLPLFCAVFLVTSSLQSNSASAQVTSDGTTGTIVDANGNSFEINAGTRSGGNLFHSFGEFSVPSGGEAVFNNAVDVSNILSRVTGGNASQINGLIQAQGSANLFLINPAGIIFGQGASLAIGGSFYGSTADSILFEDGEFSAVNDLNQPILTINAPIGLNLRDNPEGITLSGNENATELAEFSALGVREGQSLNLIGGNIKLDNAIILAIGGNVALGGLQGSGTVNINENGNLSFPENVARGNISLDNTGVSVAFGDDGAAGTINVNGNNIELNGSLLQGGITEDSGFADAQAGDINLNATGVINLSGESSIENEVNSGAEGNSGDININTGSLELIEGSSISTTTLAKGNAGNITVNASDIISSIDGGIFSNVEGEAVGDAGEVDITTANLNLTNGGSVSSSTFAQGNAGTVTIKASDTISIDGEDPDDAPTVSGISSNVSSGAVGNAGEVNITTANLNLTNGGTVSSSTFAQGNAGTVTIDASNTISVDGIDQEGFASQIGSSVSSGAVGNAGGIEITTANLNLTNGGTVSASTFAQGNAGTVTINASDTISIDGDGGIFSNVEGEAVGDAGGVNITTANLNLTNGGQVSSSTFAQGNAGTVTIDASNTISVDGINQEGFQSQINSSVSNGAVGNGGEVDIATANLNLANGGSISTVTFAKGNAGTITINASDTISIDGDESSDAITNGGIFSNVQGEAVGNGGGVNINVANLNLTNGGKVAASTFAQGDAGTVTINASNKISVNGIDQEEVSSSIESDVKTGAIGNGGSIRITTPDLSIANGAGIFASTFGQGNGGNLTFNISDTLTLEENSTISAQVIGTNANGGDITINAQDGFVVAFPSQNAGNGNDIVANSPTGEGGDITINAQGVLGLEEGDATFGNNTNDIDASGTVDGVVDINTPNSDAIEGATQLPNNPVEAGETVTEACVSARGTAGNNLVVTGKGGIPPEPTAPLVSELLSINGETTQAASPEPAAIQPILTSKGKIIPAQGVEIRKDGSIILTAYPTSNNSRIPQRATSCGKSWPNI